LVQKRAAIENFIAKELLDVVIKEVSSRALAHESDLADQLKQLTARIREEFATDALDAEGNLAATMVKRS
jgi:hypothetical protein